MNQDHVGGGPSNANLNGDAQFQISLEELVTSTVRALTLQNHSNLLNADLAALVPDFHGSPNDDVISWFERIDIIRSRFDASADKLLLVIINKLKGAARTWYNSRPEHVSYTLDELRTEMINMYNVREDTLTLMNKFQKRKWLKSEIYSTYHMDKVILGNKLNIVEKDLIKYIIDGFYDERIKLTAKMKGFETLNELLITMNEIVGSEGPQSTRQSQFMSSSSASASRRPNHNLTVPTSRCYNCNEVGHLRDRCPKPRRERGSCYSCGSMDHVKRDCPERRKAVTTPAPDSTTMVIGECSTTYQVPVQLNWEEEGIQTIVNISALLDTEHCKTKLDYWQKLFPPGSTSKTAMECYPNVKPI